jgi:hypothetical protein
MKKASLKAENALAKIVEKAAHLHIMALKGEL